MTIFKGGDFMTDKTFMRADEVAEELDVSKAYACLLYTSRCV